MEKTHAILLRRNRFSDSSLMGVWITPDHGKLKTAARGALRPGSPFAGRIDLFYEADIAFARSRDGDVHNLREVSLRQAFDGAALRYANVSVAGYFASLIDRLTEPAGHAAEVFELVQRAVTYLRARTPDAKAILHFERELCSALGLADRDSAVDPLHALAAHCGRLPTQARARAFAACAPLAGSAAPGKMEK